GPRCGPALRVRLPVLCPPSECARGSDLRADFPFFSPASKPGWKTENPRASRKSLARAHSEGGQRKQTHATAPSYLPRALRLRSASRSPCPERDRPPGRATEMSGAESYLPRPKGPEHGSIPEPLLLPAAHYLGPPPVRQAPPGGAGRALDALGEL